MDTQPPQYTECLQDHGGGVMPTCASESAMSSCPAPPWPASASAICCTVEEVGSEPLRLVACGPLPAGAECLLL